LPLNLLYHLQLIDELIPEVFHVVSYWLLSNFPEKERNEFAVLKEK
jgi:hypothetical protein